MITHRTIIAPEEADDDPDDYWKVGRTVDRILSEHPEKRRIWGLGEDGIWSLRDDSDRRHILGFTDKNHAKFFLFENTSFGAHISVVSSSNWRSADQNRQNDAIVIRNVPLYRELESIMTRLWELAEDSVDTQIDPYKFGKAFEIDRDTEIYLTPSPSGGHEASDPQLDMLADVFCAPTGSSPPEVWVAGSTWRYEGRGEKVLDELIRLRGEGCDVRMMGQAPPLSWPWIWRHETRPEVFEEAIKGRVPWVKTHTHSKYIIVDAPLKSRGLQRTKAIVAGALNFSTGISSGRNMIEVDLVIFNDESLHRSYRANWLDVCDTQYAGSEGVCQR